VLVPERLRLRDPGVACMCSPFYLAQELPMTPLRRPARTRSMLSASTGAARSCCGRGGRAAGPGTTCEHAAVPDRDGGLCRRPSPEPRTAIARPRCAVDAGEIRTALFEHPTRDCIRALNRAAAGAAPGILFTARDPFGEVIATKAGRARHHRNFP
jgi:hypothetical protein